jgi:hypothetical protein
VRYRTWKYERIQINNISYKSNGCYFCGSESKKTIVIKPGSARRVDLGPDRHGGWIGSGKAKDRDEQKPSKTCLTRDLGDPANPDETLFFSFSNVFFLLARDLLFYFFNWLLILFKVHYINSRRMFYFFNVRSETFWYVYSMFIRKQLFFQCEIWSLLVYIFYVHKKRVMFFNVE